MSGISSIISLPKQVCDMHFQTNLNGNSCKNFF